MQHLKCSHAGDAKADLPALKRAYKPGIMQHLVKPTAGSGVFIALLFFFSCCP
ncbi:MAG TPA: hypothetical protein VN361_06095 [Oxalicibacterium sp.]|nr:hypothetical protein [Oxalicibacterium sp.]